MNVMLWIILGLSLLAFLAMHIAFGSIVVMMFTHQIEEDKGTWRGDWRGHLLLSFLWMIVVWRYFKKFGI